MYDKMESITLEQAGTLANQTMRRVMEGLVEDGLLPRANALAWLDTHAMILPDKTWAEGLSHGLCKLFGFKSERNFRPTLVKLCGLQGELDEDPVENAGGGA